MRMTKEEMYTIIDSVIIKIEEHYIPKKIKRGLCALVHYVDLNNLNLSNSNSDLVTTEFREFMYYYRQSQLRDELKRDSYWWKIFSWKHLRYLKYPNKFNGVSAKAWYKPRIKFLKYLRTKVEEYYILSNNYYVHNR